MSLPTRVHRQSGLEQYDPWRDFDSIMGRFLGNRENAGNVLAPYGVDVREDTDHIYVEAELPGFKKDEIDVTLENQVLTISAERNAGHTDDDGGKSGWLLNERRYSRFLRSFTLPPSVDEQKVDAKLADGVLTIVLNKREETKPRKVTVV